MSTILSVAAIKNGTVIDHIEAGQALRIISLLSLTKSTYTVTIGLHLLSKRMASKDLIKIENRLLTPQEAQEVGIFAPDASINIIENFKVVKKIKTEMPDKITGVFRCQNLNCITSKETLTSCFKVITITKTVKLSCNYCGKVYPRDQLKIEI